MRSLPARARLLALVALEAAAIPLLQGQGGTAAVDWGHLRNWPCWKMSGHLRDFHGIETASDL